MKLLEVILCQNTKLDGKNGMKLDAFLVHDYINFDYNSLLLEGREDVISRYEYCMDQFKKLSKDRRVAGLIFAGRYDF